SGLGLYLVKNICDTLGYPIHIESIINQGTTVSICFEKKPLIVE
ncbi:MAG TPA: sensor histidine kinase, partial [Catenibacterium sp.]|nr:sensor histidine kinase [Catenibacterium sp.]